MSSNTEVIDLTCDEDEVVPIRSEVIDLSDARKNQSRVERHLQEAKSLIDENGPLSVLDITGQCPSSASSPPAKKTYASPPPQIKCVVCLEFETEITSTLCGHTCCVKCMEKIVNSTTICPVCRRNVSKGQLRRIYLS